MHNNKINKIIIKIFLLSKNEKIKLNSGRLNIKLIQNFDSLKFVKFLLEIEKKFKIQIKRNDLKKFTSLISINNYLKKNKF